MFGSAFSALRRLFRRSRFEADLDDELRDHLLRRRDDLTASGLSPAEAELRARREFGSVQTVKDEVRDSSGLAWADALVRHFRYAFRFLRHNPAFSLTATLILALCIGAHIAVFSFVNAILFQRLPYPQPERLARISIVTLRPQGEDEDPSVDGKTWEYLRGHVRSLDLALHAQPKPVNLVAGGAARSVDQMRVSSGFFRVLGVRPYLGRGIDPEEDRAGGPQAVVLGYALWSHELGADPAIAGKKIVLRGEPYTVVGVMPAGFQTLPRADLWTPLRPSTTGEGGGDNYGLIARARPGYGMKEAAAELNALESLPDAEPRKSAGVSVTARLLSVQRAVADDQAIPLVQPLLLLWAAVGLVLLIGCVNVAALILARGESRRHEIATRLALGGRRRDVLVPLLLESFLLAAAGGVAGLSIGYGALLLLNRLAAQSLGLTQPATIDVRVLAVTAGTILLTSLLSGLYPAWNTASVDIRDRLATGGRTGPSRRRVWIRGGFVVSEVALSMVLLIGFGLVLRTLIGLTRLSPGYDGRQVLTASTPLEDARYSTAASINRLFSEGLARLREYPGVQAAGVGLTLPYQRALNDGVRVTDGPRAAARSRVARVTYVTPGYFEALRFRLTGGRLFNNLDRSDSQPVAIVNQSFAQHFLKGDDPLGRHIAPNREIVGIVGDVQETGFGGPVATAPNVYIPASQVADKYFQLIHTWFAPNWVVRTSDSGAAAAEALRASIGAVDPLLPFAGFRPMDEVRQDAFGLPRLESTILGGLGGLALLLSAAGVFGLAMQTVAERTREFGIRLALGSTAAWIAAAIARQALLLTGAGVAIGAALAFLSGKLFRALIYNVKATDAATFAAVSLTLAAVALLSGLLPGLRIARIDPASTLREE